MLTLREGLRARSLPVLGLLFAGSLILTASLSRGAPPAERFRVLLSAVGQGAHLLLLLSALLTGALAHPQEIRRRSIQHLLSKPLGRGTYLAGKWLGLCGTLLVLAAGLGALAGISLACLPGEGRIQAYPLLLGQALLGDWALASALAAAALAASTLLSGPVALFAALGLAALAHGHPLLADLEKILVREPRQAAHPHDEFEAILDPEPEGPSSAAAPIRGALRALRRATPNASGAGDAAPSAWLGAGVDLCPALDRAETLPWESLWRALAVCALYAAAYLGLGWAGISRAEIGR